MQQGALARLLSNAALFSGLLAYKRLGYRSLFHDRPDTLAATLVLTVPPVLMPVPSLLVLEGWVQAALTALVPLSAGPAQPDFSAGAKVAALLAGSAAAWCLLRWLQPRAAR